MLTFLSAAGFLSATILIAAGCIVPAPVPVPVPAGVVEVDEYGYRHDGYYDDHRRWHGGYYDERHVRHEDDGGWHRDRR